jgi:hypothetical protein
MRVLVAVLGLGIALAGLALVVHQAALWMHNGTWTPIPFSDLWFALGGSVPEQYRPGHFQDILTVLLVQPLSLILFLVGAVLAWLGTAGKTKYWTKL